MKNIRFFLAENFQVLVVKFSIYLNTFNIFVFVMWHVRPDQPVRMLRLI